MASSIGFGLLPFRIEHLFPASGLGRIERVVFRRLGMGGIGAIGASVAWMGLGTVHGRLREGDGGNVSEEDGSDWCF